MAALYIYRGCPPGNTHYNYIQFHCNHRPGCLSVLVTESPYLRLINVPFVSQSKLVL